MRLGKFGSTSITIWATAITYLFIDMGIKQNFMEAVTLQSVYFLGLFVGIFLTVLWAWVFWEVVHEK